MCVVCGLKSEYHHLLTRGAYPEFEHEEWNKIPVCRRHHSMFHQHGRNHMAERFPEIKRWLIKQCWSYCETRKRWIPQIWSKEKIQFKFED